MVKIKYPLTVFSLIISLTGCMEKHIPKSEGGYYKGEIYFGQNLSFNTKKGITDGCKTAKGNYKKSHSRFKNNKDYVDGWFLGRNKCKNLLKLDENGDIVS